MVFTCKNCTKNFKKKLTLKEKFDKVKVNYCSKECAQTHVIAKEHKYKKEISRKAIPKSSKEEIAFGKLISSYFPQLKTQYKIKDYGHHYDFYSPELDLLIEYNGVYWHNMPKNKPRDWAHLKAATKNGTHLAVITDVEWKMFIDSGLPDKVKLIKLLSSSTKNSIK